jgi:hypothetical protein
MGTFEKNFIAVIVVAISIFGIAFLAWQAIDDSDGVGLPACVSEDSDNCYWDAQEQGNGEGRSFSVVDGVVTYEDQTQR